MAIKKIACVGYHATGAGVIDDLFREFDNVAQGFYEAESQFLQACDGISDLEFHLVECPNRLKTGIVVERFLRYAEESRRMHEKIFGKNWLPLCKWYIKEITKFQYRGWHKRQLVIKRPFTRYVLWSFAVFNHLLPKSQRKPNWYDYFPHETEYHACISEECFLGKTQTFIDRLCNEIPHNTNTEYVMLDQLVPADYPERYLRYVKDLKIIAVNRDPRDLYIHHRIHGDHKLPKDPSQFCEHYKDIRKRRGIIDNTAILYVNYEDMIYKYDEMIQLILNFVGISARHHVAPFKYFDPKKSIKGTKQWERYPEYCEAVHIIEEKLPDYLYRYN